MFNQQTKSSWPPHKVQRLRTLALQGLSASEIAAKFGPGYTRSSIISKCYNSDIPLRGKSTPPKVHTDRVRRKLSRFHMLNSESV